MQIRTDLKNKTIAIADNNLRYCEIYKITNVVNQKIYVGQAVSHSLKRKKYVPHGMEKRFKQHIYETFGNSNIKYSCRHLNNALKKYGVDNFTLILIRVCNIEDANRIESEEIINCKSLAPNGYNLTTTCKSFAPSMEFVKTISNGVINSYKDKRIERLLKFPLAILDEPYEKYITPKFRNKIQCGWRIRLRDIILSDVKILANKEIEFSSIMSLEEEKERANDFIKELKKWQCDQIAGTSLQSSLPLISGNINEDLS